MSDNSLQEMEFDTEDITPPELEGVTGVSVLPIPRVQRIMEVDDELPSCSNGAAFLIAVATEMFIQYLTERSFEMARSERKPRKNIQYQDVANAVARLDTLEFLSDVVPRTTTFKQYAEERGDDYVPGSDLQVPTPEALKAMRDDAAAEQQRQQPAAAGPSRQPRAIFELDQQPQAPQPQGRPVVSLPAPPGMEQQMQADYRRRQSVEGSGGGDPMQLDPRRRSAEMMPHQSAVHQQLPFELSGVDRIRVVLPPPTPTILPPEYRR